VVQGSITSSYAHTSGIFPPPQFPSPSSRLIYCGRYSALYREKHRKDRPEHTSAADLVHMDFLLEVFDEAWCAVIAPHCPGLGARSIKYHRQRHFATTIK